jgi:hypothetical protein
MEMCNNFPSTTKIKHHFATYYKHTTTTCLVEDVKYLITTDLHKYWVAIYHVRNR